MARIADGCRHRYADLRHHRAHQRTPGYRDQMGSTQAAAGSQGRAQTISLESSLRARIWMVRPHLAAPPAEIPGINSRSGSGASEGRADAARLLPPDCFARCCGSAAINGHAGTSAMDVVSDVELASELCSYADRAELHDRCHSRDARRLSVRGLTGRGAEFAKILSARGNRECLQSGQCGVRVAGS